MITLALHLLLLMFELLVCDNLESRRHYWILVFIPLIFIAIISIAICIWSVKNERSYDVSIRFVVLFIATLLISKNLYYQYEFDFFSWNYFVLLISCNSSSWLFDSIDSFLGSGKWCLYHYGFFSVCP